MPGSAISRRRSSPPTSPGTCNQGPRGHCATKESELFIKQKMSLAAGRTDKAPAALTGNLDCVVLIATGSQAGSPARRGLAMDRRRDGWRHEFPDVIMWATQQRAAGAERLECFKHHGWNRCHLRITNQQRQRQQQQQQQPINSYTRRIWRR